MFKQSLAAIGLAFATTSVTAQDLANYEVTITNITSGQYFTPQLVVTHPVEAIIFRLGRPASTELEILAEAGDTTPLADALAGVATDVTTIDGLLGPGQRTSVVIQGDPDSDFLSVAAMLIPTNDTFVALNRVRLPVAGAIREMVPAYDAGTEVNDQDCANIPGPQCGGAGYSPDPADTDEGFVHISDGIHGEGGINEVGSRIIGAKVYDWRNPVARITVRRMQ
ncbi:MAG: spondin domain-containing protein [Pseudomonadota bacterium]